MTRLAAGFALGALIVWLAAFHFEPFHDADARVLDALASFEDSWVDSLAHLAERLLDPLVYTLICGAIIIAGLRRDVVEGVAAGALIVVANVTTQLLKPALADARYHEILGRQIDPASWPSGHATGAAVAALAAVLVTRPPIRRRVALVGGALSLWVGAAVLVSRWHYPSDVLGGYLVAAFWASAAAALLSRRAATTAPRRRWLRATG